MSETVIVAVRMPVGLYQAAQERAKRSRKLRNFSALVRSALARETGYGVRRMKEAL